jgi:hypothetical protein
MRDGNRAPQFDDGSSDRPKPNVDGSSSGKRDNLKRLPMGDTPPLANHQRGEPTDPYAPDDSIYRLEHDREAASGDQTTPDDTPTLLQEGSQGNTARARLGGTALLKPEDAKYTEDPTAGADGSDAQEGNKPDPDRADTSRKEDPPAQRFTEHTTPKDAEPDPGDVPPDPPDVPGPPTDGSDMPEDDGNWWENEPATDTQIRNVVKKAEELARMAPSEQVRTEDRECDTLIGNKNGTRVWVHVETHTTVRSSQPGVEVTTGDQSASPAASTAEELEGTFERESTSVWVTYFNASTGTVVDVHDGQTTVTTETDSYQQADDRAARVHTAQEKNKVTNAVVAEAAPHLKRTVESQLSWVLSADVPARTFAPGDPRRIGGAYDNDAYDGRW